MGIFESRNKSYFPLHFRSVGMGHASAHRTDRRLRFFTLPLRLDRAKIELFGFPTNSS